MRLHFHFEIVLNKQFLFFEPVVHFRLVLICQILKALDSPVNSLLTLGIHNFQKIPLKQGLLFSLLN